jgi:acyl carrier protein
MSFKQELLSFLQERVVDATHADSLDESEPLLERGLIDSLALLQLIVFIEERAGVRVPDEEVILENFQTVSHIDNLVQRLRQQGQTV